MALLNVNGSPVIRGQIRLPRVGVWSADLKVDTTSTVGISGPVTIASTNSAFSYSGVAYREGIYGLSLTLRVIGGAGGLAPAPGGIGSALLAKSYSASTVGLVLQDILTACGERLSSASDQSVLSMPLTRWTRFAGSGKAAVQRLLEPIATSWRTMPDGSFWVGTDTYPPAATTPFDLLDRHWGEGRVVIASQQPFVQPGTLLSMFVDGVTTTENVSNVVHFIEADRVRSEVWFERSGVQS